MFFFGLDHAWRYADLGEMEVLNTAEFTEFRNKPLLHESLIDQVVKTYETLVQDYAPLKTQTTNTAVIHLKKWFSRGKI